MPKGVYIHKPGDFVTQVEAMARANRGKHLSLETKQKISENNKRLGLIPPSAKGRKWSDESRARWSAKQRGSGGNFYGKHHSVETRIKLSEQQKGELGPNWGGGTTPMNKRERKSVSFKLWKEAVLARDNWTCQGCGQKGGDIYPHHIKSFAKYPELRFDVDNGITLCDKCHKKTRNFGGRAIITPGGQTIYQVMAGKGFLLGPGDRQGKE